MQSLSTFLNRISNWKTLLFFLVAYFFFNGYILKNAEAKINALAGKPIGVIDLTFSYNPQKTLEMVAAYGDAARGYYARIEMTADVIYPIVYAFLFGIILTLLYRNKSFAWINRLPFVVMILDFVENVYIIILLKNFPQQSTTIAILCEIFKLLKWIGFSAIILLVILGLMEKLVRRKKKVAG